MNLIDLSGKDKNRVYIGVSDPALSENDISAVCIAEKRENGEIVILAQYTQRVNPLEYNLELIKLSQYYKGCHILEEKNPDKPLGEKKELSPKDKYYYNESIKLMESLLLRSYDRELLKMNEIFKK